MIIKEDIINDFKKQLKIIDTELKQGYAIDQKNSMVIEEVITNNLPTILNTGEITNYSDIHYLKKALEEIKNTLKIILEEYETKEFFKDNKTFDRGLLKKRYNNSNIKEKFPKFNIDKFLDILENPILKFDNYRGETIIYDSFWVKKNLIAIVQMIFNEMDLYILNIGKEGSGKSCWSSQQILYFYELFKLVGLIDYAWDIKKMFFADILSFLDEDSKDYFSIKCLDEGNELNRGNFREESNQQFKYEMRTERKMLRVILINMQQIGELDTSISLSRVNFIYECKMRNNKREGTLKKGYIDMYIIPRSDNIYSNIQKKTFSRTEILNNFAKKLDKKKDYYVSLPSNMLIHKFKFNNIWGFNKEEYDEYIKNEMSRRKFEKSIKITNVQAYILNKKLSNFIKLGTFDLNNNNDKKLYNIFRLFLKRIDNYFIHNPEKQMAIEKHYNLNSNKSNND